MSSRVPRGIRWTKHKTIEELLDDPLAEGLYGLFLKVKDSPRHISIKPELLINEAYRISNLFYQDDNPKDRLDLYAHEIELDLGWKYAVDLVMSMVYVILKAQGKNPSKVQSAIGSIEKYYHNNIYWNTFCGMSIGLSPHKVKQKKSPAIVIDSIVQQCKQQFASACGKEGYALNLTINLNNEIKDIEHLHLAHADVAVGIAEAGSNVYHHKNTDNGK